MVKKKRGKEEREEVVCILLSYYFRINTLLGVSALKQNTIFFIYKEEMITMVIVALIGVIILVAIVAVLARVAEAFMNDLSKNLERDCFVRIKKSDEKFEEEERVNRTIKNWLFN